MFILDDLLISPLVFIARKVQEAAQQEAAGQEQSITSQLTELYGLLESGAIDEAEFDRQETGLLDLLDEIRRGPQADDNDDGEFEQEQVVAESNQELVEAEKDQ